MKKRIFAVITCIVILFVFSLGAHATTLDIGMSNLAEQAIQDYSKYIPSELSNETIENICNFVNGDNYVDDAWIDEIRHCGTVAMLHINYHYSQAQKARTEIPQYLSTAYNKINNGSYQTNGTPVPRIAYAIHPSNAAYYIHAEPSMSGGSQSTYTLNMGPGYADEIYIVICNAGTSGTMTYSYNITIGS